MIFILLYKMLNDYEVTMIEGIFIAIDWGKLSESYCEELVDYLRRKIKKHTNIYCGC